jgi:hypothetical protein
MKRVRTGAVLVFVSALLPAVAGVAVADPLLQEKDTVDGYHLKLSIDHVDFQSVPNMAAAPFVREGFVTATSRLEFSCKGGDTKCQRGPVPVAATLSMWAQVGCPMDVSGGITSSANPNVGASLPIGSIIGAILPPPTPAPTPGPSDITDIALAPTANVTPQLVTTLAPGSIRDVPLGMMRFPVGDSSIYEQLQTSLSLAASAKSLNSGGGGPAGSAPSLSPTEKSLAERAAGLVGDAVHSNEGTKPLVISVQNAHLVVDRKSSSACGGVVAVRIYAQGTVQSPGATDTVDIYGDIYNL